jgi:glycosyltransferase involved in cell wall biosynthesis
MFLSIIIPVFNTEKYLQKCLSSVLAQDIPANEYEIIVVNDGSTDNSQKIIDDFKQSNNNIRVLCQTNSGQSAARNKALNIAKGEYIWFVDSDDYISEHCLGKIHSMAAQNPDIIAICAEDITPDNTKRRQTFDCENATMSGINFLMLKQYHNCVPFYIFNRHIFDSHEIRFKEGIIHEDNEILPKIFYYADNVHILNEVLYHINANPTSTTRSVKPKRTFDLFVVVKSQADFIKTKVAEQHKGVIAMHLAITVNAMLYHSLSLPKDKRKEIRNLWKANREIFGIMKMATGLKYKTEGFIFTLFPGKADVFFKLLTLMYK